jgi:class 3 adenylate cyclase
VNERSGTPSRCAAEVISGYQKRVAEIVQRLGGYVAKYMGDGVLVYFGYPQGHEDDAERAVRAGLELIAAVAALQSPVSLQTRVGIATGLVVVGDLIGTGAVIVRDLRHHRRSGAHEHNIDARRSVTIMRLCLLNRIMSRSTAFLIDSI